METARLPRHTSILKKLISVQTWPHGAVGVPSLQAHRGYWKKGEQENTLGAFRAAKQMGALMSELDVQLSKDRIPVVFHDEDTARFSSAETVLVSELSARELKEKVNAPTLEEVLFDSQATPYFNIELKTRKLFDEALERKVFEVIGRTDSFSRVLFSSFNPASLWRMGQFTEKIPLALIVAEEMDRIYLEDMWLAPFIRFHLLHIEDRLADQPHQIEFWKDQRVPYSVWTVNNVAKIRSYLEEGAMSVISDQVISDRELIVGK